MSKFEVVATFILYTIALVGIPLLVQQYTQSIWMGVLTYVAIGSILHGLYKEISKRKEVGKRAAKKEDDELSKLLKKKGVI